MIYTVTLNPCLDRHLEVESLKPDDANRIQRETRYAAGKGIDVSRVIAELGGHTIALGFLGGFDGMELEGRLINEGVQCDFTQVATETRINIQVFDRSTRQMTSINAPGPEITPAELGLFCQKIRRLSPAPSAVALSGSIPRGVTKSIYNQLGLWLKEQGARVVLDADREAFAEGIHSAPFMVKPNRHELSRFTGVDLDGKSHAEILKHTAPIFAHGVEVAMVSLGGEGLIMATRENAWHVQPPAVKVESTIGAGDSLVAGFMYGITHGASLVEAAVLGAACGAATARTPGTALCRKAVVDELKGRVEVRELNSYKTSF